MGLVVYYLFRNLHVVFFFIVIMLVEDFENTFPAVLFCFLPTVKVNPEC